MATFEASTATYDDEIRTTVNEIGDYYNLSIGALTAGLSDTAGDESGTGNGFCGPFGFQFCLNTIVIGLLCICGLVGNTVSILVLQKDKQNGVAVFLLQSLAIADNSLLCLGFIALSAIYGLLDVVASDSRFLYSVFVSIKYINTLGSISHSVGTWLTVLLAVNRYVAVCRPFKAKRWLTMACARAQVTVVVVVCVLLNSPRVLLVGSSPCQQNASNCSEVELSSLARQKWFGLYYLNVLYSPIVLVMPLILLLSFNVPIIRQMQRAKRRMKRNSLSYSGRQENSITLVMVVIILELIICHAPERIVQIVRAYDVTVNGIVHAPKCPEFMYVAANLTNFLVIANASTNFIIYYVLRERFRRILSQKLCCSRGSNLAVPGQSPLPTSVNGDSLHHHHHHRKSSAEEDVRAMTRKDRYRLIKKRDSNQICLLKVNNTCM